jgi:hypothetical protein
MSSSPLLKNNTTGTAASKPSILGRGLVSLIGISRTVAGVGCLLAPTVTAKVFGFSSLSPEAALLTRMFGVREIVIGEGLLLAERYSSTEAHAQQQVKRATWANVATDGLDLAAVLLTLWFGVAEGLPLGMMSAMAGLFVGLGFGAVWAY